MKTEFYIPELEQLRPQSTMNKQGREDQPLEGAKAAKIQSDLIEKQNMLFDSYSGYIEDGLARELARINLPLSNYTEWYWKIDLHNLFHFLRLRMDSHAQYEIQVYGEIMAEMVKAICPHAYEAFEDFSLNSAYFSGSELKALKSMINTDEMSDELLKESGLSPREAREFKSKLDKILKNK
jgi:thymidylate synthase (FAD)